MELKTKLQTDFKKLSIFLQSKRGERNSIGTTENSSRKLPLCVGQLRGGTLQKSQVSIDSYKNVLCGNERLSQGCFTWIIWVLLLSNQFIKNYNVNQKFFERKLKGKLEIWHGRIKSTYIVQVCRVQGLK